MKDELFNELLESVREGGTIEKTDVQQIRAAYRLSQNEFATLLGISLGTLRNWEQGRRAPQGPARVLLQIAARHPDAVWDVVQSGKSQLTNKKSTRKQKSL
jgi:putative transcriptional regulator